jgi:hypothetical protein
MRRIRLVSDSWSSEAVQPSSFFERLRGLIGQPHAVRLLFETSSVHTLGMTRPISVVVIGKDRRVLRAQSLQPNRVIYEPMARFILEMPDAAALPEVGALVEIVNV